jgi:hypothetical protein
VRVLTVHDPYASAIARGLKSVENRKRQPPSTVTIPFEMAIHASVKRPTDALIHHVSKLWPGLSRKICDGFSPGHVIAVVDVVGWFPHPGYLSPVGWVVGPCCWRLENAVALSDPVPCRGQQGLWTLPDGVETRVLEQIR